MRGQVVAAVRTFVVLTVLVGVAFPVFVTAIAQFAFDAEADGSLVRRDGVIVGSRLLGQAFDGDEWFHPRPSVAGDGYDGGASGSSNLGPSNDVLLDQVATRVADYRTHNGLADDVPVPVDAVTSSGSGLDPHISIANARLQAGRVAKARQLAISDVLGLIETHTDAAVLGFLGEDGVNVLELNMALSDAG
jgi:K+-transporting ATPase ATPase C chain